MGSRVDEFGRAFAGSQLQIQTYVNRRQGELDAAIASAVPELQSRGAIFEWVSPIETNRFTEYYDAAFLARLGLTALAGELASFWPQGGPHWDALARIRFPNETEFGVILLEAKSYPGEMVGNGCLAAEPSLDRIRASIMAAKSWLGAEDGDWTGQYYQFANRLAHLYFLREICGVQAWLINACFFDDPHKPTRAQVWRDALEYPIKSLGLANLTIPFYKDVLLPGLDRNLLHSTIPSNERALPHPAARTKEWRFLCNDRTGRHQFLGFGNAKGSCSVRYFDSDSGARLGDPHYGRGRNYQNAFASELAAGVPVKGPAAVSVEFIPVEVLRQMRCEVGLDSKIKVRESEGGSLLSGVNEFIDDLLRIAHIGSTSPHYKHRGSYQHVARSTRLPGNALVQGIYDRIEKNWPGTPCRSDENWRFVPQLFIDPENASLEKRLEKAIAEQCANWVNMVPVCSGVMPVRNEGGRRIDLVHQRGPASFEFLELKIGQHCDTPLYAALEILCYGIIYVFSRRNADRLGYSTRNLLLSAKEVSLVVLGPADSYCYGSLSPLQDQLNQGLRALVGAGDQVSIDFRFECFREGTVWQQTDHPGQLLESRRPVYAV